MNQIELWWSILFLLVLGALFVWDAMTKEGHAAYIWGGVAMILGACAGIYEVARRRRIK